METEAASTAVRTRTQAPRVAATRSMPSTRTVGHASVSRHLRRARHPCTTLAPWVASWVPEVSQHPSVSRFPRRKLKEHKKECPQVQMGSLWRLSRGHSATLDQAPLLCVTAGFLWVLILDMGGGPRQGSVRRRKMCVPQAGSVCS